jgi:hypothetical protein
METSFAGSIFEKIIGALVTAELFNWKCAEHVPSRTILETFGALRAGSQQYETSRLAMFHFNLLFPRFAFGMYDYCDSSDPVAITGVKSSPSRCIPIEIPCLL